MTPERGSDQKQGEKWDEFFRRQLEEKKRYFETETMRFREIRLQHLSDAQRFFVLRTADYYEWCPDDNGFLIRRRVHPFNLVRTVKKYTKNQHHYDKVMNEYDLLHAFAPLESVANILVEQPVEPQIIVPVRNNGIFLFLDIPGLA